PNVVLAEVSNALLSAQLASATYFIHINRLYKAHDDGSHFRYAINVTWAVADYTQKWFDRRVAHTVPLAFTALGFLLHFLVVCLGLSIQLKTLSRVTALLAFAMSSQIYIISGIASNELFPTPIRSICFAFLQVVSRMGVVFAPQLFLLVSKPKHFANIPIRDHHDHAFLRRIV
ncbi:unnamed protein product, partial [Gongylonema pulchrum]|uniref:EXPERA domain-containing protein n=1 Tax=Gongylonema pulchrum TaxID=637853 RepID=A0A183CYJ5_9BILA